MQSELSSFLFCVFTLSSVGMDVQLFSALFWLFLIFQSSRLFFFLHPNQILYSWSSLNCLSLLFYIRNLLFLWFSFNQITHELNNWLFFYNPWDLFIFLFLPTDSTKITLAPSNTDVKVRENTSMQCAASHDQSLDITFIWSLDGRVIDLHIDSQHYERTTVRHHVVPFIVFE